MNIFKNYKEVLTDNKIKKYSDKIDNASLFLTFLAVRKYIDQDFNSKERFMALRMLNMFFGYKKSFYNYIDPDFFEKSKFLFTYINKKEEIFNLSYVFDQFVNDYPEYFNEKEIIKIKYLFNHFENNPKFKIIKIFNAKNNKIQSLTIGYYLDNFRDVSVKGVNKIKKYYKYALLLACFIFITFII